MSLLFAREGPASPSPTATRRAPPRPSRGFATGADAALAIEADITREADVARMVTEAADGLAGLDGIVLNVGIGVGALRLAGVTQKDWDETLAVNLRGADALLPRGAPEARRAARRSSSSPRSPVSGRARGWSPTTPRRPRSAGSCATSALEGSRRGIRANVVCPGLVDTPLGRMASAGRRSRGATPIPFGRQATGWEIAYAALFFISDESVYVTGQTLAVDSGLTGL